MTQLIRFNLNIGYDRYLGVYQGISKTVRVKAEDGRIVEFPAVKIRPFLTREGIHGHFEMKLSSEHKFIDITKLR